MAAVRTIICGSPQPKGKCAHAAGHLLDALRVRFPEDRAEFFSVASLDASPCMGCNACQEGGRCVFEDGMGPLLDSLARSEELYVVCPVYFAGPPSQMKALLDRLQPLYASFDPARPKRAAKVLVVGDGGDPHGYDPLVGILRSALAVAGFSIEEVLPCIAQDEAAACRLAESLGEAMPKRTDPSRSAARSV